jgi:hypothetical protein
MPCVTIRRQQKWSFKKRTHKPSTRSCRFQEAICLVPSEVTTLLERTIRQPKVVEVCYSNERIVGCTGLGDEDQFLRLLAMLVMRARQLTGAKAHASRIRFGTCNRLDQKKVVETAATSKIVLNPFSSNSAELWSG